MNLMHWYVYCFHLFFSFAFLVKCFEKIMWFFKNNFKPGKRCLSHTGWNTRSEKGTSDAEYLVCNGQKIISYIRGNPKYTSIMFYSRLIEHLFLVFFLCHKMELMPKIIDKSCPCFCWVLWHSKICDIVKLRYVDLLSLFRLGFVT